MPFDPLVVNNPAILDGNVQVPNVLDPNTQQPVRIIPTTDSWSISASWDILGLIAPFLAGDWNVSAYLEALDGGTDPGQVGTPPNMTIVVPLSSVPLASPRNYSATINVPAGQVRTGLFNLTVAITYTIGGTPEPMAGFNTGPILQFI